MQDTDELLQARNKIIARHVSHHEHLTIWPLKLARLGHVNSEDLADILPFIFPIDVPIADLGCGRGYYVHKLQEAGFDAIGFDGTKGINRISYTKVKQADLSHPFKLKQLRNIICLEVAEHLLPEHESQFIDNIVSNMKDMLLLSWAIIGQGGDGHNNCRCNIYVQQAFEKRGLILDKMLTIKLRELVNDASWFKNTLFVFRK